MTNDARPIVENNLRRWRVLQGGKLVMSGTGPMGAEDFEALRALVAAQTPFRDLPRGSKLSSVIALIWSDAEGAGMRTWSGGAPTPASVRPQTFDQALDAFCRRPLGQAWSDRDRGEACR